VCLSHGRFISRSASSRNVRVGGVLRNTASEHPRVLASITKDTHPEQINCHTALTPLTALTPPPHTFSEMAVRGLSDHVLGNTRVCRSSRDFLELGGGGRGVNLISSTHLSRSGKNLSRS
jgi:hypothetical protein